MPIFHFLSSCKIWWISSFSSQINVLVSSFHSNKVSLPTYLKIFYVNKFRNFMQKLLKNKWVFIRKWTILIDDRWDFFTKFHDMFYEKNLMYLFETVNSSPKINQQMTMWYVVRSLTFKFSVIIQLRQYFSCEFISMDVL